MKEYLKKLKKIEILKNFFVLASGSTIAQVSAVLLSPILSRLYDETAFALLGVFNSMIVIISSISTGKFEMAVVLPKLKKNADNLVSLSFFWLLSVCLILTILALLFEQRILAFIKEPLLEGYLIYVPMALFFYSFGMMITNHFNREKEYKKISLLLIIRSLSYAIAGIGLGIFVTGNQYGLIWSKLFGYILSVFIILVFGYSYEIMKIYQSIQFKRMKFLFKKYINFINLLV